MRLDIVAPETANAFRIVAGGSTIRTEFRTGPTTTVYVELPTVSQQLTIVPVSQFTPPTGGVGEGTPKAVFAEPAGAPSPGASGDIQPFADHLVLDGASITSNNSSRGQTQVWAAWRDGDTVPTCQAVVAGDYTTASLVGGGATLVTSTTSNSITLPSNQYYRMAMCASNGYGVAMTTPQRGYTFSPPTGPANQSYTISTTASESGGTYTFDLVAPIPSLADDQPGYDVVWFYGSTPRSSFSLDPDVNPGIIQVKYCVEGDDTLCSTGGVVGTTNYDTTVEIDTPDTFLGLGCPDPDDVDVTNAVGGAYDVSTDGSLLTVTLNGAWSGLSITRDYGGLCDFDDD